MRFCPIGINYINNMKKLSLLTSLSALVILSGCGLNKGPGGELTGVSGRHKFKDDVPYGMVYIPGGTFLMGATDEDITGAQLNQSKQVTVSPFYMDETEISNNQYRQFVYYVRDSIAAKQMGGEYLVKGSDGNEYINPKKKIDWGNGKKGKAKTNPSDQLKGMFYDGDDQIFGKKELNVSKLTYNYAWFDWRAAANSNGKAPRSSFIHKDQVSVYPDTLVWIKDFAYAQNEPMVKSYFSHPAYDNYPVVGVTWRQARAFCDWRTKYFEDFRARQHKPGRGLVSLPSDPQFEWAARGGRVGAEYPWGGPYIRNAKGCLLANFKPGRGDYASDGGAYTVNVKSYFPNDYGLYNMSGNVAEWTISSWTNVFNNFTSDLNPTYSYDAKPTDPAALKRKIVRGGSWKDIGYYLQTSTRTYEYQDSAKSYIGFRCVIEALGAGLQNKTNPQHAKHR